MTLQEVLSVLGPEKVRRGMAAFDDPNPLGYHGCFIGRIFGERCEFMLAFAALGPDQEKWHARLLAPMGITMAMRQVLVRAFDDQRDAMRAECIAYLAEHGTAIEPGIPAVQPLVTAE